MRIDNKRKLKKFIKYYKYFIILRNVLSNYFGTNILNIKLESITIIDNDYFQTGDKSIDITFKINNNTFIDINLIIKPDIMAYIRNFKNKLNYYYEFEYYNKEEEGYYDFKEKKFYKLVIQCLDNKRTIVSKNFTLKNLIVIEISYFKLNYKVYNIYKKFDYMLYPGLNTNIKYNEFTYIPILII